MDSRSAEKATHWQSFFDHDFAIIATLSSFALLAVQLLIVSGGHDQTAIFLLVHADKVPLLLGMFLPIIPAICVFASLTLFRAYFIKDYSQSKITEQVILFMASVTLLIGIAIGDWWTWIGTAVIAYYILDFHFPKWFFSPNARELRRLRPTSHKKIFYTDDNFWSPGSTLAIFVGLTLVFSGNSWLPTECVTLKGGKQILASVVSVDAKYAYLMGLRGHNALILESSRIVNRKVDMGNSTFSCDKRK